MCRINIFNVLDQVTITNDSENGDHFHYFIDDMIYCSDEHFVFLSSPINQNDIVTI